MQIQTSAFLLGSQNIHSSKSNKDFVKFNFVIEGRVLLVLHSRANEQVQALHGAWIRQVAQPDPVHP